MAIKEGDLQVAFELAGHFPSTAKFTQILNLAVKKSKWIMASECQKRIEGTE